MGERPAVPLVAVLLAALVAVAPAVATAQASTTLELQDAVEGDTDQGTLSYTFTVQGQNDTQVSITSRTSQSRDGGDVELNYQGWEAVDGSGSGGGTSWTATGGERYRVTYTVSARSGAGEGSYSFDFRAQDDRGNSYATTFSADVEILSPQFGTASTDETDVVFGSESQAGATVVGSFQNTGEGVMLPEEVTYSNVPSGITVGTDSLSDRVDGGSTGEFSVDVSVSDAVGEGTYDFTATITDNLGNSVQAPVTVRVFKPPAVGIEGGNTIDLGDVVVGGARETEVTLSEETGNGDIDDLDVTLTGNDQFGSIDLSGLDGSSIRSGGSVTRTVRITADSEAPQGTTLEWRADVTPRNARSPTERVAFTATVIYPPYYDGVTADGTALVYDEPRSTTSSFTREAEVSVRNGGDLPMELTDASVTTTAEGVSARVLTVPDSIAARSSGTVVVEFTGDPDAPEDSSNYTVTLDAERAGRTEATGGLAVLHRADVTTTDDTLEFREIPIRESRTRSTTIRERLGYKDVENFTIERTAGPDQWLTVVEPDEVPESLGAGEDQEFLVDLTFDANATLYETYRWEFRITGNDVEPETVEVTGVPIPVQCTRVRNQLEEYEGDGRSTTIARSMAETIGTLEDRLRENPDGPLQDLSRACTAGRSTLLFLDANEEAGSRIDAGNRSAAQTYIGRMAAGFNTMESYVGLIETDAVRSTGEESVVAARTVLNERVESQTRFYEESVSGNTTVLREAEVSRELARLATLQGEEQRARELDGQADEAFDRYATLVSEANDDLLRAREIRETMDRQLFVEVVGVRAFWLGSLDRFESRREAALSHYRQSSEKFARAGASQRAATADEERAETAQALQQVYWISLGLGGAAGVVLLLVLGFEARGVYRYVQDSREMVSGDFLL